MSCDRTMGGDIALLFDDGKTESVDAAVNVKVNGIAFPVAT